MTDFKKGDRVHVEYYGVVIHPGYNRNVLMKVPGSGDEFYISDQYVTKLPDPLPTTVGSVVRDDRGDVWMLFSPVNNEPQWTCSRTSQVIWTLPPADFTVIYDAGANHD